MNGEKTKLSDIGTDRFNYEFASKLSKTYLMIHKGLTNEFRITIEDVDLTLFSIGIISVTSEFLLKKGHDTNFKKVYMNYLKKDDIKVKWSKKHAIPKTELTELNKLVIDYIICHI